jgi:putative hydrolase of the HAD superfamily
MILQTDNIFVFDLDDTLYPERDFEKSGIEYVCQELRIDKNIIEYILGNRKNWIETIIKKNNLRFTSESILDIYRHHKPEIQLYNDSRLFLQKLNLFGAEMSLITDGRSITQRNKLKALGVESLFNSIVISEEVNSEKPAEINYKMIMKNNLRKNYIYFADNPQKDFLAPNKLGWISVCLMDRGQNVHKQNFNLHRDFLPQYCINSFDDISLVNE